MNTNDGNKTFLPEMIMPKDMLDIDIPINVKLSEMIYLLSAVQLAATILTQSEHKERMVDLAAKVEKQVRANADLLRAQKRVEDELWKE